MKQKFDSRWWAHHLPLLMVLVIALLVAAGFVRLARGSTGAEPQKTPATGDHSSPPPTQAQIDALKEQVGDLQSKADVLKSNEEDLKLVLELILGASGLFAIAQGIFAAFSSSSFTDQAERLISNAEKQTERLISNAKEQLAAFTLLEARMKDADANRANLRQSLASNSPIHDADEGFNWRRRLYEEFPVQTRRRFCPRKGSFPIRYPARQISATIMNGPSATCPSSIGPNLSTSGNSGMARSKTWNARNTTSISPSGGRVIPFSFSTTWATSRSSITRRSRTPERAGLNMNHS